MQMLQHLAGDAEAAKDAGVPMASLPGGAGAATDQASDDVINRMMEEFDRMGNKDDFDGVLEGMMRQLLSKSLMYAPMKEICDKVRAARSTVRERACGRTF
ncbi:hypothetical protein EON66_06290 [archaeon]|nr:MAG: hypothetical protein EON66_06290 [archaeon]